MTFGEAIEHLKAGRHLARKGWNGKGMWIAYVYPNQYFIEHFDFGQKDWEPLPDLLPWIGMKTADNKFVPWLASQSDMLSDDWEIVG